MDFLSGICREKGSLLSHDLLFFFTNFSKWHQRRLIIIIWWTGFKRTRQSCHHRKQSQLTCKGLMLDNNLKVFSMNSGEFKWVWAQAVSNLHKQKNLCSVIPHAVTHHPCKLKTFGYKHWQYACYTGEILSEAGMQRELAYCCCRQYILHLQNNVSWRRAENKP